VVCSSFKFPPTALDEEAGEEFRARESQVHAKCSFLTDTLDFSVISFMCSVLRCFCTGICISVRLLATAVW